MTVTIELGDTEYELEVSHFERAVEAKGWDPGAGGEIELEDTVKVWGMVESSRAPYGPIPGVVKRISLTEFLDIYAEAEGISEDGTRSTRSKALAQLEDYCYDDVVRQQDEDFDDRC